MGSTILSPNQQSKVMQAAFADHNGRQNSPLTLKYKKACYHNYRLKRHKIAVDIDTMEPEQIVGIYKILEKEQSIESSALWSCFFNYNEVIRLSQSEVFDESQALKDASNQYSTENRRIDKLCNSPVRSKYLSQNYLDNYLFVEGICKNLKFSQKLSKIAFCGLRLSIDSMRILSESIIKNKVLKEVVFNFCLLDIPMIEAIMPALCQNTSIETVNFSCNGLEDDTGYLMAKIVSSQSERRDQVVWTYSLRGELPPNDEYKNGLKQLILSHNNFSDILASELILALRNDLYLRSIDLRNNKISPHWVEEFVKLMKSNGSLTNIDLRENPGLTIKLHRKLALGLLRNIQDLKEKGELELDSQDGTNEDESEEIKGKFVKFNVFTVEIPQKFMKKFSQKLMAIKKRKGSTGRNSSIDLGKKDEQNINQQIQHQAQKPKLLSKKFTPSSYQSRASTAITKTQSSMSIKSTQRGSSKSQPTLKKNSQFAMSQEINIQNVLMNDKNLEPIGEESKIENSTSMNQLKQRYDLINDQRTIDLQAARKGHTQVSSVEIASPQQYLYQDHQHDEHDLISIDSSAQKVLKFNDDDLLEPLKQKNQCNHCKKCKDIQKHFYLSESKGLQLAIENYKLRKVIQTTLNNNTGESPSEALSLIYSQNQSSHRQSVLSNQNPENDQQIISRMDELMQELKYLAQKIEIIPQDKTAYPDNQRQNQHLSEGGAAHSAGTKQQMRYKNKKR
ncbi:UNKNOWN [Stylonychia lemnae]|uniref:Leucine Rich Repeat family protein n=1 Tax=Stylonychia lemnae TaxID=5949 RepID=A0A078A413_STYLE|nr:UNKNOWN [Stylonychia lemnae]|eukprot:CDW75504.1 UNKNOWN [Stylonychia lemnae]